VAIIKPKCMPVKAYAGLASSEHGKYSQTHYSHFTAQWKLSNSKDLADFD
jgi:hypothetical protein